MRTPNIDFPAKLMPLWQPHRYKVLFGGRGGGKSWNMARALLVMGAQRKLRVLCAREFQNSIKESVKQLLDEQIRELGLGGFYESLESQIRGSNGTEFVFAGLRSNITSLKSFEGADICWVAEAVNVSKRSWDVLIPTIRKEGSEIWLEFNPELEEDETYKRFVKNPPRDAKVIQINWRDNEWFPDVLRREMEDLKFRDEDAWLNVWEGQTRQVLDGAVYAKELREVLLRGGRRAVPYDPSRPVHTFWDLGRNDMTAIWFAQIFPMSERRIIDYVEGTGEALGHYVQQIQGRPYGYGTHYLPHDARHKTILHPLSVEGQLRELGWTVQVASILPVAEGISAVRTVLPTCWFDEERTAAGWSHLVKYRYGINDKTQQRTAEPLHDDASHASDALRTLAVSLREQKVRRPMGDVRESPPPRTVEYRRGRSVPFNGAGASRAGWMGR